MRVIVTNSRKVKDKNFYANDILVFEKNYGEWGITSDCVFSPDQLKYNSVYELDFNRKGRLQSAEYLEETTIPTEIIKILQGGVE